MSPELIGQPSAVAFAMDGNQLVCGVVSANDLNDLLKFLFRTANNNGIRRLIAQTEVGEVFSIPILCLDPSRLYLGDEAPGNSEVVTALQRLGQQFGTIHTIDLTCPSA